MKIFRTPLCSQCGDKILSDKYFVVMRLGNGGIGIDTMFSGFGLPDAELEEDGAACCGESCLIATVSSSLQFLEESHRSMTAHELFCAEEAPR